MELAKDKAIIITGAAGFIASCLAAYLNGQGYTNLILVDDFGVEAKRPNWETKQYARVVERQSLFAWLAAEQPAIGFVFHLGARTDTTEFDYAIHQELNVEYSQQVWNYCTVQNVPLVYASSAATYGDGALGYEDAHAIVEQLQPLNPYGVSKNEFDKWVLHQEDHPPFWAGLKFFNVYGANEYHKGRMASVIFHSLRQIRETGKVKLFQSHKTGYKDGEQLRDFVYVKDVVKVCYWLMQHEAPSGLYNLGTGQARTFNDLVKATFAALDREAVIEYIPMPEDIRDKYQYFTEADMQKLRAAGYADDFYSLEAGVDDYVREYLGAGKYW
jgi:ADP-L-glycero-D-manno-heptose 6-epimerase